MNVAAKDPEERQRRILQASIEVLRSRGFAGTRVADVAAAAGVSPAMVLYHFTSLTDLLVAALESVEDEFYQVLADVPSGSDPRDTLVAMISLSAEGGPAFGDWQLWLEVWGRGRQDPRINELQRSADLRWRGELESVISRGVTDGVFVCVNPAESVLRLSSLLDGLAVRVVLGAEEFTPRDMVATWLGGAARELQVDEKEFMTRMTH